MKEPFIYICSGCRWTSVSTNPDLEGTPCTIPHRSTPTENSKERCGHPLPAPDTDLTRKIRNQREELKRLNEKVDDLNELVIDLQGEIHFPHLL
jgi:hypothetical protein